MSILSACAASIKLFATKLRIVSISSRNMIGRINLTCPIRLQYIPYNTALTLGILVTPNAQRVTTATSIVLVGCTVVFIL